MGFRSALHQARAALTQLLQFREPAAGQGAIRDPAATKHTTASGAHDACPLLWARWNWRAPGIRPHCHNGQFPVIANSTSKTATDRPECAACKVRCGGRGGSLRSPRGAQMIVLAGLEVTTKSVVRTAEAMGADIAKSEEDEIRKNVRLDLPITVGDPVPILYVQQAYR
jgi:hypothetical protein